MVLEGLDQYTPAPEALERPEWVAREGNVWAQIDGSCQPVLVDDAAAGRLEITTCVDAEITCGVAITATGEATLDRAWCRTDQDFMTGLVDDGVLRLITATDDHAAYRELVNLTVGAVGQRHEWQQCTDESLRELERQRERKQSSIVLGDSSRVFFDGSRQGLRMCTFVDGFRVTERPLRAPEEEGTLRRASDDLMSHLGGVVDRSGSAPRPVVDCMVACASESLEDARAVYQADVEGRVFIPPEPRGIDLFRTTAACAAATSPPSVLPTDLCATLGARLR